MRKRLPPPHLPVDRVLQSEPHRPKQEAVAVTQPRATPLQALTRPRPNMGVRLRLPQVEGLLKPSQVHQAQEQGQVRLEPCPAAVQPDQEPLLAARRPPRAGQLFMTRPLRL